MARGGIYKSEVLRARAKLLAQGINPSIDAVRIELGNTGSKSTIHRYLREIEEEEGPQTGSKVAVSEAIVDLAGSLANRLYEESEARIAEATAKHNAVVAQLNEELAALRKEADAFRLKLERSQLALAEEQERHKQTATSLHTEALERAKLVQQVMDLQERLSAEESHRQSLEEKHQHAREALEHFRQSMKEQREQDQRQHEQQIQYLQGEVRTLNQTLSQKQQEAIQSNKENARLTTELARAETGLHDARTELRSLKGVKDQFTSAQKQAEELGRQVVELNATVAALNETKAALEIQAATDTEKIRLLEIDIAAAQAARSARDEITATISEYLAGTKAGKVNGRPGQEPLFKP